MQNYTENKANSVSWQFGEYQNVSFIDTLHEYDLLVANIMLKINTGKWKGDFLSEYNLHQIRGQSVYYLMSIDLFFLISA